MHFMNDKKEKEESITLHWEKEKKKVQVSIQVTLITKIHRPRHKISSHMQALCVPG